MSYISTFSGGKFYFEDPSKSDIRLVDIAHALSCINRFNGHLKIPVSVAQHSVMVYHLVAHKCPEDLELQRRALLHDATEAYLGDVSSPLKAILSPGYGEFNGEPVGYRDLERSAHDEIMKRFGLPTGPLPDDIKWADSVALKLEAERGLPPQSWTNEFPTGRTPGSMRTPWRYSKAEKKFLDVARKLELV